MGYDAGMPSWFTLRASTSIEGARRAAEVILTKAYPDKSPSFKMWEPSCRNARAPRGFPGRLVDVWSSRSVGGIGGNPWCYIAVAELLVEDDILERLAEI